ncbi:MAG TPA: F0F1 ATP synthase subunit delta, partial [Candidatus Saccharimonadales bacterium]|nr:F0F1 ATP synthase subunit delta [Candidatus Saccharimonadales bacterium]
MISAILARRYARALLELSKKRKDLEATHQDLESVARVFERDPRVRRFFEAPNIARTEKEAFLDKQFSAKLNKSIYGLLILLLRRRRF